jgi:hypothetical protein
MALMGYPAVEGPYGLRFKKELISITMIVVGEAAKDDEV